MIQTGLLLRSRLECSLALFFVAKCEDLHSISVMEKRNLKQVTMSRPKNEAIVSAALARIAREAKISLDVSFCLEIRDELKIRF